MHPKHTLPIVNVTYQQCHPLLMFGQFSDTTQLQTILDRDLPNFADIGQTRTDFFLKLAPLLYIHTLAGTNAATTTTCHHRSTPPTPSLMRTSDKRAVECRSAVRTAHHLP